jgi:hypothetical protein
VSEFKEGAKSRFLNQDTLRGTARSSRIKDNRFSQFIISSRLQSRKSSGRRRKSSEIRQFTKLGFKNGRRRPKKGGYISGTGIEGGWLQETHGVGLILPILRLNRTPWLPYR